MNKPAEELLPFEQIWNHPADSVLVVRLPDEAEVYPEFREENVLTVGEILTGRRIPRFRYLFYTPQATLHRKWLKVIQRLTAWAHDNHAETFLVQREDYL